MKVLQTLKCIWRGERPLSALIKRGLHVGKGLDIEPGVVIDPSHCWLITIGDNVTLAPRTYILAHDASTKRCLGYTKVGRVTIGDDVFIGAGSIVMPGVSIGDHVIIGAGSVVTHDLDSGAVYAGNPAKYLCQIGEYLEKEHSRMKDTHCWDESYTIRGGYYGREKERHVRCARGKVRICSVKLWSGEQAWRQKQGFTGPGIICGGFRVTGSFARYFAFDKRGILGMDKLLTIVIPAYNVENTLEQAVSSMLLPDGDLFAQMEILIVNDGSKDKTSDLGHALAEKYPAVVRVIDKENGGHGSVLNTGVRSASGKYMRFLDGDDWMVTEELEKLLGLLQKNDVDMVVTDYYCYSEKYDRYLKMKISKLPANEVMYFADIYDKWTFLFNTLTVKTDCMRRRFREVDEHCYYVDMEFVAFAAINIDTVYYADLTPYVYRVDQAGQSISIQGRLKHFREHERVAMTLVGTYEDAAASGESDAVRRFLLLWARDFATVHYRAGLSFPHTERKMYCDHLRDFDAHLKEKSADIYSAVGDVRFVSLCRSSNFSFAQYSMMGSYLRYFKDMLRPLYRKLRGSKKIPM